MGLDFIGNKDRNNLNDKLSQELLIDNCDKIEKYVINLHLLEACNFKCKYCFAHFDYMKMLPVNTWKIIVDNISSSINVKRFNLAGGEPLLYPDLQELILYIKEKGFEVSIITNGFLLTEEFIKMNKDTLDCIGISVDSFDANTLVSLNCKTSKGEILDKDRLLNICKLINDCNIDLKINTVVSKLNYKQDLSPVLKDIKIDRWKILKMKLFKDGNFDNSDLDINMDQFRYFVKTHENLIPNTVVEDTLKNSYIIIDSEGYLVDNSYDKNVKTINVVNEDFMNGFKKLSFDKELYFSRYRNDRKQ